MSIQSERLAGKINELQTLLKKFPEGNLICAKNGNHHKWYQTDGTIHIYIPKNQRALAEQLVHKSSTGILDRSKSESLIVTFLHMKKIPFRYECALSLDETTIYPDFTIRHPKTGKVYYWEHFGMMDQPAYAKKTSAKLQLYISHGIIPSMQLITTYETKE